MKKYSFTLLFLLILISLPQLAQSKITVTQTKSISVSPKFPEFETTISASQNGTRLSLTRNNIVIREMNYGTIPDSVTDEGGNNFRVKWTSKLQNRTSTAKIFITYGSEVGTADVDYPEDYAMPFVRFANYYVNGTKYDFNGYSVTFTKIPAVGDSAQINITFKPTNLDTNKIGRDIIETPVRIDSIRTHTPYFSYRFYGNSMTGETTSDPPAFDAHSVEYMLFVYFKGHTTDYYQDKLTIYYNGGQIAEVNLIANNYTVPIKTRLKITKPEPGTVLTPCFQDTIRWTGAISGLVSKVQFSNNNGATWRLVGQTLDSFLVWTIPSDITENALLKVSQIFARTTNFTFSTNSGYNNCRFIQDAAYLIASSNDGRIEEYNQETSGNFIRTGEDYSLGSINYPDETSSVTALDYLSPTSENRKFAAVYNSTLLPEMYRTDKIAFFQTGNYSPIKTIDLGYKVKNAASDSKYRYFAVLPDTSDKIVFYSCETLDSAFTFIADKPIRDFKFVPGSDSMLISLESNDYIIYDLAKKQADTAYNFESYPLSEKLALSPDGRLLSFATVIPEADGYNLSLSKTCQTHVIELSTMRSARSYYGGESKAIGIDFNPTSTRVIKASRLASGPAHVVLYNLSDADAAYYFNVTGSELGHYNLAGEGNDAALITDETASSGKMTVTKFPYPESDVMDSTFAIRLTNLQILDAVITDKFIDTRLDTVMLDNFSNVGSLPLIVTNAYFKYGKNFKINQVSLPDTLLPGERLELSYIFNPVDTGRITDTLIIETCAQQFMIPFISRGLPRNIALYDSTFDFGEVCIGETTTKHLKIFRNADPVPLNINYVSFEGNSNFRLAVPFKDTIIAAGDDFFVDVVFTPTKRGTTSATCVINHSKQYYMAKRVIFTGVGLGSDIQLSHSTLYFIPEYPTRTVTIKNLEVTPFTINAVTITPSDAYTLTTQLPVTVSGGATDSLTFVCNTQIPQNAVFHLVTNPCISQSEILAAAFTDNVKLKLSDTKADPRGMAAIDITAVSSSNSKYNGSRFYEGEFSINPSIFLPDETSPVKSEYGTCKLTKNEISNGLRFIGFRVEGIFPDSGIVASINGYAGLTSPTTSPINFVAAGNSFGTGTNLNYTPGSFTLINLCGDHIIIPNSSSLKINEVYPNPVDEELNISIESEEAAPAVLEIYDYLGILRQKRENIRLTVGSQTITEMTSALPSGSFICVIRAADSSAHFTFLRIKK